MTVSYYNYQVSNLYFSLRTLNFTFKNILLSLMLKSLSNYTSDWNITLKEKLKTSVIQLNLLNNFENDLTALCNKITN